MTRTLAAALALAAGLSVLSACSEGEAAPPPTIGDETSASQSPSPRPSASPSEAAAEFDDVGSDVLPGAIKVRGDEQQAVVDAWLAYWAVRTDIFLDAELDPAALGEVAQGDAADQVISYAAYLQQKGRTSEGDIRLSVGNVRIKGDRATLRSCGENQSTERRADGKPAEQLRPYYELSGALVRQETGQWLVTEVDRISTAPCETR